MIDQRLVQAKQWLTAQSTIHDFHIKPLAGDASFRRYFRVHDGEKTYVLMDAPPKKEDVTPFLRVCDWLEQSGLNTPTIIIQDHQQGFLLLEDFGDETWSVFLKSHHNIAPLFTDALAQLHRLQNAPVSIQLPLFDVSRMQNEVDLYLDWYLPHLENHTPHKNERASFHQTLSPILEKLNQIPKAPVHLDYHSRNLMIPKQGLPLGIIDFQDAVLGPITYDLASLLYDCYQNYPETERLKWSQYFFEKLPKTHQNHFANFTTWHQTLRLTALQRHIKAIGIFSRLAYRDGKKQFLKEIPLTQKHLNDEIKALALHIPLLNSSTT